MSERKASDVFVECLEAEGVKYVFGIPGEETLDLNESLEDSTVQFVPVRHEQGGAYMADAYGRLTGRAGVCLGTLGPGATNLVTAVADAFLDRAPLVALTGQSDLEPLPAPAGTAPPAVRPPKPEANEPVTVGTIKGRVVSNDGRPLTNANIMAQGVSGVPTIKMKRTDAEGAFVFDDLPAGLYIVLATAPGYIDQSWTGSDPGELPRHLIGERLKITMIKGGVITGVVTDSKGQPVVGVPVQASPPSGASSLSSFMGGTTSETDDRGVYRIYGLPPGQYAVAAGGAGPFGQFTVTGFELDVLTYYPSATRDTAVPVAVRSGDEATGIDIKYRGTEGHAISGVVLGPVTANAVGGAVIIILSSAGSSSIQAMALASAAEPRVFSFNGIADGEYDLFAGFQGGPTDNPLVASKRVVVRNGDLTGVELKLHATWFHHGNDYARSA